MDRDAPAQLSEALRQLVGPVEGLNDATARSALYESLKGRQDRWRNGLRLSGQRRGLVDEEDSASGIQLSAMSAQK